MTKSLVLLPSARYVDKEMQLEVGKIPPALIPLNGKPLLESIIERFAEVTENPIFAVAVSEGRQLIEDHLARKQSARPVQLLEVQLREDLGHTITGALDQLQLADYDNLIINFGDTLIDADVNCGKDAVYYQDLKESFRWTTFKEERGKLTQITDKFVAEHLELNHVFTGLFVIKDLERFAECLRTSTPQNGIGLFYSALLQYLDNVDYELIKVKEWYDFGHADNYYQAKKKFVNKRFFNQIEIDEHRAVLKKKSTDLQKFTGEIKWYLEIPSGLRCYIPQVFDYSLGSDAFIKMEYYGYPTIADLYMFSGYNLGIWNHVFDAISRVVKELQAYRFTDEPARISQILRSMYLGKTLERTGNLRDHGFFKSYFTKPIQINGCEYKPLDYYLERLEKLITVRELDTLPHLSIVHGDFCISNILFDPKSRILKLVDPRGRFGEQSIYGDYRYELAKLSHSFNGHYESIIGDSFFAICDGNKIDYSIALSEYQNTVTEMFNKRLLRDFGSELEAIKSIEALLFLSMIPLHGDFLHRQIMMLAVGVEKIDAALKNAGI